MLRSRAFFFADMLIFVAVPWWWCSRFLLLLPPSSWFLRKKKFNGGGDGGGATVCRASRFLLFFFHILLIDGLRLLLFICRCEMMQKSGKKNREKGRRNDSVRSFLLTFFTFRFFWRGFEARKWWKTFVFLLLYFVGFGLAIFVLLSLLCVVLWKILNYLFHSSRIHYIHLSKFNYFQICLLISQYIWYWNWFCLIWLFFVINFDHDNGDFFWFSD